jgi:glutaredoxin
MKTATFYHAGCPVCVSAEESILKVIDKNTQVDVVHLGEQKNRIPEAENLGVKSVPALVLGNQVLHINYGASLEDVKG